MMEYWIRVLLTIFNVGAYAVIIFFASQVSYLLYKIESERHSKFNQALFLIFAVTIIKSALGIIVVASGLHSTIFGTWLAATSTIMALGFFMLHGEINGENGRET